MTEIPLPGDDRTYGPAAEKPGIFWLIAILELIAGFMVLASINPYVGGLGFLFLAVFALHGYVFYVIWNWNASALSWGGLNAWLWISIINLMGIGLELMMGMWALTIPGFIVLFYFQTANVKSSFS
ncbi:MAG: hypothetical protein ACFE7R_09580 [Candidatus Hodarchaeota archaeon]